MLNLWFVVTIGCLHPGATIKAPPQKPTVRRTQFSEDVHYLVLRAMLHAEERDWKQCNAYFSLAAQRRPRDPFLHMYWGDAAMTLNETEIAIQRYREALGRFGVHRSDLRAEIQQKINKARL